MRRARDGVTALVLAVWMAVAVFQPFVPGVPQMGLDGSWVSVLGEAADRGARWGIDVVYSYGPASPLVTHYGNAAYLPVTLPLSLLVALLFGLGCTELIGRASGRDATPRTRAIMVATLGVVAAGAVGFADAVFLVLPLLPLLLVLAPSRRRARWIASATALVLGVVGMAKMGFPVAALPLLLLADAVCLLQRRLPVLTVPFGVGFLAGDLLYRQRLGDLPAFLAQQSQVVAGYSDAMALDGSRPELAAFLAGGALLVWLAAAAAWRSGLPAASRLALPIAVGVTVAMLLKAGFVRQDLHTTIAWSGLALAAALLSWARLRLWRRRLAGAVLVCATLGALWLIQRTVPVEGGWSHGAVAVLVAERKRLLSEPARQVAGAWALLRQPLAAPAALDDAKARRWQQLAALFPMPPFPGSVDVIPSMQSRLLANGLDYRPRPNFQEYSTYTPALLAANQAFLMGPRAPDWMIFGQEPGTGSLTIDRRYPALAEGALWPDLLRLYRPVCRFDTFLALRRRASPAELTLGPARHRVVAFDRRVPIVGDPGDADGRADAVLARIVPHPSLLGRIAALAFRPAPLVMTVDFADGRRRVFQFITGIAAAGFVLSPFVDDATSFLSLAEGRDSSPERRVVAFEIHAPDHMRSFFLPDIDVDLETLAVARAGAAPAVDTEESAVGACEDAL